ncbi:enoyl-CoA hydratase-related protein [uncultured Roseibium sp.]|uniref:enoyl-CoA hydratase-related protein n=1 Tax=uncultured Roseibium sp. TaxID=1936171 RepID=UPI002612E273|nr:enoyl-CoA hydratase-related protein [uncultured Roseibium sp.]
MPDLSSNSARSDNPLLVVRGQVAELLINAPDRKNALPLAAWSRIPELLAELAETPDIRVCVVKGAGGRSFCAGADISEFEAIRSTPEAAKHYDDINVAAFKALKALDVPVVAAIEGPCLGGGLGVALACDLRLATRSAFFGIPAAKLGLAYPPEALGDLMEAISSSNAKHLLFTGESISAERALQIGLINEMVEDGVLDERMTRLTDSLCANAPLSLKAAKGAINLLNRPDGTRDLKPALQDAQMCIDSADYKEGYRAFLEKRRPVFKGI